MGIDQLREIKMLYKNNRGETTVRRLVPIKIFFGQTEWHQDEQWLLEAYDVDRTANRTYALREIRAFF